MKNTKQNGFTLIELLVIIVIIGILVSFTSIKVFDGIVKARDSQRKSDLKQLQTAVQLYFQDYNEYPASCKSTEPCWTNFFGEGNTNTYIKAMPQDPLYDTDHFYNYCRLDANNYVLAANLENSADQQIKSTTDANGCSTDGVNNPNWYWVTNP